MSCVSNEARRGQRWHIMPVGDYARVAKSH